MDVDPSPIITNVPVGSFPESAPVVCLPYSLVPGLDTTSQSYQKAVATLGKQQTKTVPIAKSVPLISVLDRGMTVYDIIITCLNFDDIVISASQDPDPEAIKRSRNIINNAVMQELKEDNPSNSDIYGNVLRHHIISACQHLRVSLFTVEALMSLYNEHAGKKKSDDN